MSCTVLQTFDAVSLIITFYNPLSLAKIPFNSYTMKKKQLKLCMLFVLQYFNWNVERNSGGFAISKGG